MTHTDNAVNYFTQGEEYFDKALVEFQYALEREEWRDGYINAAEWAREVFDFPKWRLGNEVKKWIHILLVEHGSSARSAARATGAAETTAIRQVTHLSHPRTGSDGHTYVPPITAPPIEFIESDDAYSMRIARMIDRTSSTSRQILRLLEQRKIANTDHALDAIHHAVDNLEVLRAIITGASNIDDELEKMSNGK